MQSCNICITLSFFNLFSTLGENILKKINRDAPLKGLSSIDIYTVASRLTCSFLTLHSQLSYFDIKSRIY